MRGLLPGHEAFLTHRENDLEHDGLLLFAEQYPKLVGVDRRVLAWLGCSFPGWSLRHRRARLSDCLSPTDIPARIVAESRPKWEADRTSSNHIPDWPLSPAHAVQWWDESRQCSTGHAERNWRCQDRGAFSQKVGVVD